MEWDLLLLELSLSLMRRFSRLLLSALVKRKMGEALHTALSHVGPTNLVSRRPFRSLARYKVTSTVYDSADDA
jgi:hypothetical protein